MTAHLSIDQVRASLADDQLGYFRYVRVGDEFRFSDAASGGLAHIDLQGSDTASGAGFLKTYPDGMFIEGHSSALCMGSGPGDEKLLSELLGLPIKCHWS